MMESRPQISNNGPNLESRPNVVTSQFFNRIENSIIFAATIVIHKSRNLIGSLGSSEFWPKWVKVSQSNVIKKSLLTKVPSSRQRAQGNKGLQVTILLVSPPLDTDTVFRNKKVLIHAKNIFDNIFM